MSIDLNNIMSLSAMRTARLQQTAFAQASKRLASGMRVSAAVDNPAGMIAAASMSATLAALDAETQTNERAMVVTSIADGALGQISDLLEQAKGLVAANANAGGLSSEERAGNQVEIDAILNSVDRLSRDTKFAGKSLLDGTVTVAASGEKLQLGNVQSNDLGHLMVDGAKYTLADLRSGGPLDTTAVASATSMQVIAAAIENIATLRGKSGAFLKNDIEPRLAQLAGAREHLISTVSIIEDADTALEVSAAARAEILAKSSQSMLGYALMKSAQSRSHLRATRLDVHA